MQYLPNSQVSSFGILASQSRFATVSSSEEDTHF